MNFIENPGDQSIKERYSRLRLLNADDCQDR